MNAPVIVGIGEILFDILEESEELGGAPANFAYHVNKLGAKGYAISTVGNDPRGEQALEQLRLRNLSTDCITVIDGVQTGYVRATLDSEGVASYTFPDDIAWDHLTLNERALSIAGQVAGVCFGSLAQRSPRSRQEIYRFLDLTPGDALKVFDLNLRQTFYTPDIILQSLGYADILKLNDEELPVLAALLGIKGSDREILTVLMQRFDLRLAALTRGGQGSLLVSPQGYSDHPGVKTAKVIDTIGAGDAFTAAIVIYLLNGDTLDILNDKANRVAALVCAEKGAMPVLAG